MKFIKLSTILLLFVLISASCQDDDDLFEIQIGDENAVIQKTVDGIEFKSCLLNEQGKPSTVFSKGENFSFQFSFKNLTNDTIVVTTEFVDDEFFRVYQVLGEAHIDKGKSWTGIWCDFSLNPHEIEVLSDSLSKLHIPWRPLLTDYYHPLCAWGSVKDDLPVGKFLTSFGSEFHYQINENERMINNLMFKINFEIK